MRAQSRRDADRRRDAVFGHYGEACACCGESVRAFLVIDHIDGGGTQHLREIGGNLYRWLIANDFPDRFQTLCHNCNSAKYRFGECPHVAMRSD